MASSITSGEEAFRKGESLMSSSLFSLRLGPDYESAGPLFERASVLFKNSKDIPRAIASLERAAQCQKKVGSPWHAAKHLESCAAMSAQRLADGGSDPGAAAAIATASANFARRASALFLEAGRASAGAEALARCAKLLEGRGSGGSSSTTTTDLAAALYDEALDAAELDGSGSGSARSDALASDLLRSAIALALVRGRWSDAASLGLRLGEACERAGAHSSQARAYLGAIVALLHGGDAAAAWATYDDVAPAGGFGGSEEGRAASALFDAYRSGGGEVAVRAVVGRCAALRNLDGPAARLALKLPSPGSDLAAMAAALGGGGRGGSGEGEDDIT